MHCQEIMSGPGVVARLVYSDGAHTGRVVFCLPGDGPSNWQSRTWSAFAERLAARGMRMLIPEYPAHFIDGETVFPLSDAVGVCNQALAWLEEHEGCRPAIVIASSFGGAVVLAEPGILSGVEAMVMKSPAADLALAYLYEHGEDVLRKWAAAPPGDTRNRALNDALACNLYGNARNITIPVLLIHGADDIIVPADQARVLSAVMPQSRLHIIAACDHYYSDLGHWGKMIDGAISFIEEFC